MQMQLRMFKKINNVKNSNKILVFVKKVGP